MKKMKLNIMNMKYNGEDEDSEDASFFLNLLFNFFMIKKKEIKAMKPNWKLSWNWFKGHFENNIS